MTKKPKLTVKQAKFVKGVAEGKTGTQAYLDAYNSNNSNTAKVEASKTLSKPNVQEALQIALSKQGITLDKIVKPIADGLIANKIQFNGDQIEYLADHNVRLKASSMAQQIIAPKGEGGTTVNVNFNSHAGEQRKEYFGG